MRRRVTSAAIARLATVRHDGRPHVVPVCFAVVDDEIVSAVDAKPKSTTALARLDNVRANPAVTLLVDHYDDDWTRLWWVRVDGTARVDETIDASYAAALAAKYPQYEHVGLPGPAVVIGGLRFTGWASSNPTRA